MEKTLYISDMDGTLLDREGWLSDYTIRTVRRMVDEGKLFTVATARTLQSVNDLVWYLGLRLPVVLANGANLYDPVAARYLDIRSIPLKDLAKAVSIVEQHQLCSFLYTLRDDLVTLYYRELLHEWDVVYHDHNIEYYHGRVYKTPDLSKVAQSAESLYIVVTGPLETLSKISQELQANCQVASEIYSDVYNDFYYMDIFAMTAPKAEGMLELQRITGAEEIVAFGDSFNDMPMLLGADRAYVPKNGIIIAQNVATEVLDYAHRDSVAHFLSREFGWE